MDFEAILAILYPIILSCLEARGGGDAAEAEVAEIIEHPNRRQKIAFFVWLPRRMRVQLRSYLSDPQLRPDMVDAFEIVRAAKESQAR